jgi:hypothetical protein
MHSLPRQPKHQREEIMHDRKLANQTPRRKAAWKEERSRFLKKAAPKTFITLSHGHCQRQRP